MKKYIFSMLAFVLFSPDCGAADAEEDAPRTTARTHPTPQQLQGYWDKACTDEAKLTARQRREGKGKNVESSFLSLARKGFIPARLRAAEKTLNALEADLNNLNLEILRQQKLPGTLLSDLRQLEGRRASLSEWFGDVQQEIETLQRARDAGDLIIHDITYYNENGICLIEPGSPPAPVTPPPLTPEICQKAHALVRSSLEALGQTSEELEQLSQQVQGETRRFLLGARDYITTSDYRTTLQSHNAAFQDGGRVPTALLNNPDSYLWDLERTFGLGGFILEGLAHKIQLKTVVESTFPDTVHMLNGLLPVLCRYSDEPHHALWAYTNLFVHAHDERVLAGTEILHAWMIALHQAMTYLEALEIPELYTKLLYPKLYARTLTKPPAEREKTFNQCYNFIDEENALALYRDRHHFERRRLLYATHFLNVSYRLYRDLVVQMEEAPHPLHFISCSEHVRQALQEGHGKIASVLNFGSFSQEDQGTQVMFVHKQWPYTIRVDKPGRYFRIGYLERHPYAAGVLQREPDRSYTLNKRDNEIGKFTSIKKASGRWASFFIPHGYELHPGGWWCAKGTGKIASDADSQGKIKQLLDAAHFFLGAGISF